jgi:hydroxymethylpyrimidine pyrophosphatase-like HAD family hydrolase
MSHIESIPRDWEVQDESKLVEDRHSQIAYSLIGFNQEITKKESFDPGGLRRAKLLVDHPLVSDSVEVKIAGTTTLDYFKKGHHKGKNIAKLIDLLGWERSECVYIGDQLYKGGNDEDVIGVIETREVKNPSETEAVLKEIL